MTKQRLRIGTRSSKLALTQARWVAAELGRRGTDVELVEVSTSGDQNQQSDLSTLGTVGVFTKEIQSALLEEHVDVAVHSLKDLPSAAVPGLQLAAVPHRENPADVLICGTAASLTELPSRSRVGTGSPRRRAQLLHARPDLAVQSIRGNVDTRLRKLDNGECDALVLAAAGLTRLGFEARITAVLSFEQMLPAVGQGALGLEVRADDRRAAEAVAALDHPESHRAVAAERALMSGLGAGCQAPVGALCEQVEGELRLTAVVLNRDGSRRLDATRRAGTDQAAALGTALAETLLTGGAAEWIAASRDSN